MWCSAALHVSSDQTLVHFDSRTVLFHYRILCLLLLPRRDHQLSQLDRDIALAELELTKKVRFGLCSDLLMEAVCCWLTLRVTAICLACCILPNARPDVIIPP